MVPAPAFPVPWGTREALGITVNPHFTKDVLLHERDRYLSLLEAPGVTLVGFLRQIGVLPPSNDDTFNRAGQIEEWPADQQQLIIQAIIWAIQNHTGIVFSWMRSTTFDVYFPTAWDGDYLPILLLRGTAS